MFHSVSASFVIVVRYLVFTVNVFTEGVDFADLTEAYVRIVNADTEQEFGRLRLAGGGLKGNAVIFAKLYRGKPNEPWQLLAIGKPETLPGMSSAQEMVPHIMPPPPSGRPVLRGCGCCCCYCLLR